MHRSRGLRAALMVLLGAAGCAAPPPPVAPAPAAPPAAAATRSLMAFADLSAFDGALPAPWADYQFEKIPRKTVYDAVIDAGTPAIRGHADRAASAVRHPLALAAAEWPQLSWEWKVAAALAADCRSRATDDCAARLLVLYRFDPQTASALEKFVFAQLRFANGGQYPPYRMLCYAWVGEGAPEGMFVSPVSDRVRIVPLRRGATEAGRWVRERRDHRADYRAAFGAEPPPIEGIALMVDSDDTGGRATAWFRGLRLLGLPAGPTSD